MNAARTLNLIISTLLLSVLAFGAKRSQFTGKVPVLQGYTNENSTYITALREPGQEFTYEITQKNVVINVKANDVGQKHNVDTLEISGITPGVPYELVIRNKSGAVVDAREFQSLDQNMANPKAAVCSCARQGLLSPDDKARSMWDRMMDQKPNAIFALGDMIYGDNAWQAIVKWAVKKYYFYHPSYSTIQKRYIQSWKNERIYRQAKMIPVYSVWDDHDFGYDAADVTNPFKKKMFELFRAYYPIPQHEEVISRGPGVSYSFSIFGKKVLMLDNRSFYSENGKVLLGMDQINWIEQQVHDQKEVVIASGMSIINISDKQESLERDAPTEWEAFRNIFRAHRTKAIFLTGDVHYSEVRQIPESVFGYKTYVVVSSHMHSTSPLLTPPFKSGKTSDPNQLLHVSGRNFAMLSFDKLFTHLDTVFHRHNGLAPVEFIGDYGVAEKAAMCRSFYK